MPVLSSIPENLYCKLSHQKVEILAMTDSEGILYTFDDPKAFCYDRYTYILKNVPPPLISEPLKIKPEIKLFLEGGYLLSEYRQNL